MFKDTLRRLRKEKGISQTRLAEILNYSPSSISMYESSDRIPHVAILRQIADFFGVTVSYLLAGEEQGSYYINQDTADKAQELFENKDMRLLFDAAKDSRPEDLQMAADLLRRLKATNPDG